MPKQVYIYRHLMTGDFYRFSNEQFHPSLRLVPHTDFSETKVLFGTPWEIKHENGWYVVYRCEYEDNWHVAIRGGFNMDVIAKSNLLRTAIRICENVAQSFPEATFEQRRRIAEWLSLATKYRLRPNGRNPFTTFRKKYNLTSPFAPCGRKRIRK